MKISLTFLLALFCHLLFAQEEQPIDRNIYLADPTIFYENGIYYLYGTGGGPDVGFLVYTSTDRKHWEGPRGVSDGYALKKGDAYGSKWFWAPQVFRYKEAYYMAYTADECIAIARSESPLGPFKQDTLAKLPASIRQIDSYVFFDEDGKVYLYHVRLNQGNRLFVAELNEDLTAIREETLTECISAQGGWEDTQQAEWPVAEGPTVFKQKGIYYFFYSANDFRNIDYAVGYATSRSPYGPWEKQKGNPLIDRHLLKQNGTGHGDLFVDKEGLLHYVFHVHHSNEKVSPRKTAILTLEVTDQEGVSLFKALPETFFLPQRMN